MGEMMKTECLYLEDSYSFACESSVVAVESVTEKDQSVSVALVTDRTIFHPQGGGQPADFGTITLVSHAPEDGEPAADASKTGGVVFNVRMVRKDERGVVLHIGEWGSDSEDVTADSLVGRKVEMVVDEGRRRLNARLHSAGHAIDVAMSAMSLPLIPTKGYHFEDGPNVEYEGSLPVEMRAGLPAALTEQLAKLVAEDIPTEVKMVTKEEAVEECGAHFVQGFSDTQMVRVLRVAGNNPCPCGGTHVKSSAELGEVVVTKVKAKGKKVKVSYTVV